MLLAALTLATTAACTRRAPAPRPATPAARPVSTPAVARAEPRGEVENEEEEQREIMRALNGLSRYPDTAEGLREMLSELARESRAGDRERVEAMVRAMTPDRDRVELAMTFDGARHRAEGLTTTAEHDLEERVASLRALRGSITVRVEGAEGEALRAGRVGGMDPRMAALSPELQPRVRFWRAELRGSEGGAAVIEPVAFLAGRWTWLGEVLRGVQPGTAPSRGGVTTAGAAQGG